MKKIYTEPNQAWVIHFEKFKTVVDGPCKLYVIIDAFTEYCFSQRLVLDIPSSTDFKKMLKDAKIKSAAWPIELIVLKKDPAAKEVESASHELGMKMRYVDPKNFRPIVESFSRSFLGFKEKIARSSDLGREPNGAPLEQISNPDPYSHCSCASGNKFKFCCKPIYALIGSAMETAQAGDCETALSYLNEAEKKVGLTAELLCRYAIVWSFFDRKISKKLLKDALKKNPNHPRSNYIMGIEFVSDEKFEKAVEYYQRAIQNYPADDHFHLNETYNNLGTAYYNLGSLKAAKESWEKGFLEMPTDQMTRRNLIYYIYENETLPRPLRKMSREVQKILKC